MRKLLLIIDYQYDFVADDGALTAGAAAQAIERSLLSRTRHYLKNEHDVLCTLDTHPAKGWTSSHPEGKLFPAHCVEGTDGWQLYGKLGDMGLETLTKTSYMLDLTDLDWLVRQYDEIELAGVATEICVLQNGIGLYNHAASQGLPVNFIVTKKCVAGLSEEAAEFALDYLKNVLGFTIR